MFITKSRQMTQSALRVLRHSCRMMNFLTLNLLLHRISDSYLLCPSCRLRCCLVKARYVSSL